MNNGDAFTYWVNNTDFRLFPEEAPPGPPTWCEVSLPLVEWGDSLLYRLSNDPDLQDRLCEVEAAGPLLPVVLSHGA